MYMERSTWTQVRDYFKEHDLVIIGVGSTECHGRHNPLGTDTMAPDKILELLEQRDGTYLVAPTLPYGATDDLVGYPGTVSLGVQGLYDVLSSITRQLRAYGARRFVFLNGHGGNVKSLSMASMDLNDAGCLAAVVNWWRVAPQLDPAGVNLKDMVAQMEIGMIRQALSQSGGVVAKASEILGLRRTTLVEKMKKYGLTAAGSQEF